LWIQFGRSTGHYVSSWAEAAYQLFTTFSIQFNLRLVKRRATRRLAAAKTGKHSAELLWQRHYSMGSCITAGFAEAPSPVWDAGLQRGRKIAPSDRGKGTSATVAEALQHGQLQYSRVR